MYEANLVVVFARKLNELSLVYMVTGSVAAVLYGEPRVTHDVDVVVVLKPGPDIGRLARAFPIEEFYCPNGSPISGSHENGLASCALPRIDVDRRDTAMRHRNEAVSPL